MRPVLGRLLAFSAVVVAVLAFGGCGGDDAPAKVESKATFIAAGDKICRERDKASVDLAETTEGANTAQLTSALADIYAAANAKLLGLDLPPGADRAGAKRFTDSVGELRKPVARMKQSAEALAAAIAAGRDTTSAVESLATNVNTVQAISDLADQNARSYGFRGCGQQQTGSTPIA